VALLGRDESRRRPVLHRLSKSTIKKKKSVKELTSAGALASGVGSSGALPLPSKQNALIEAKWARASSLARFAALSAATVISPTPPIPLKIQLIALIPAQRDWGCCGIGGIRLLAEFQFDKANPIGGLG
jgi:hypothetical protein